ncbi:LacI family DNA-binding transcriptional regulator [Arthrobacter sp. StoSoilB5]|uniref:LacI family DNA-binding transcriptional regulator n=1 Tax=Arthrobacter sp. StoSoilB5 TaxID=2830992 RepID=UPI001CC3C932|nr:LacI family DNA-binding transcriptional regulator [Arthrobacter sp. StoSoilB5]BCW46693.1 alanine racemase [Arthrobacter sp. StoSoilB5]
MPSTVEAVAELANVSVSTVSRALRDVPGVSLDTRKRVQRIAKELGYVPSLAGSRLATGRTGAIAIVTPNLSKWFFGQVLASAGRVLREAGFDVLLYELADAPARQRFFAGSSLAGRADGVLIFALQPTPEELATLEAQNLPVAFLGSGVPGRSGVRVDDRAAGRAAVRHLLNLGHDRIAFVGIREAADSTLGGIPPAERLKGYREALAEAGLEPTQDLEVHEENTTAGGSRAMARLLCTEVAPTAVFVASDEMAFGVLRTLKAGGIDVPGDMSVIGFDNHELSEILDLTTMDHAVAMQGSETARRLLALITPDAGAEPDLVLSAQLVVRGTTAPPFPLRGRRTVTPRT